MVIIGLNPAAEAADVAAQAFATLSVEVPDIETAPAADQLMLVGLRTWLWTATTGPATATATIPGLSATVTATHSGTTFTFDDDATLDCPDGGVAYDRTTPGSAQDQTCTHVFQTSGDHIVTANSSWTITWTATNGINGTLPDLTRTSTATLPLHAAEAATD